MWWHIAPDAAQHWVSEQLESDRWSKLDFVAYQVPIAYGAEGAVLSELNLTPLETWIPISDLVSALRDEIEALPPNLNTYHPKPTLDARRTIALARLRAWSDANQTLADGPPVHDG
jgi:hypothetical protein